MTDGTGYEPGDAEENPVLNSPAYTQDKYFISNSGEHMPSRSSFEPGYELDKAVAEACGIEYRSINIGTVGRLCVTANWRDCRGGEVPFTPSTDWNDVLLACKSVYKKYRKHNRKHASEILGAIGQAVECDDPEISFEFTSDADYAFWMAATPASVCRAILKGIQEREEQFRRRKLTS